MKLVLKATVVARAPLAAGTVEVRETGEGTETLGHYAATYSHPRERTRTVSVGLIPRAGIHPLDLAARALRALGIGVATSDDSQATLTLVEAADRMRAALREPPATYALTMRDAARAYDEARAALVAAVMGKAS